MSQLTVYRDDRDPDRAEHYRDFADIVRVAGTAGFRFERWTAEAALGDEATPAEVLTAYGSAIERLQRECRFAHADVVSIHPGTPNHPAIREKFLDEHTHSEDEARFFVDGAGLFVLHLASSVYAVRCERGDLISVPAGTPHWFDMGPTPHFKCIRFFTDQSGWVANYTGADIARRFPGMTP